MTYYTHSFYDVNDLNKYLVIANYDNGSSRPTDPHNEIAWIALGNIPAKISGHRFIIVEGDVVSLDPNMDAILAAEQAARDEAEALELSKAQAIVDELPSWLQISTAIDNATTIAAIKIIIKKALRILYLWVKNSVD